MLKKRSKNEKVAMAIIPPKARKGAKGIGCFL